MNDEEVVSISCADCDSVIQNSDDMTDVGNNGGTYLVCEDCASNYVRCERRSCGDWIDRDNESTWTVCVLRNGRRSTQEWCDFCRSNYAWSCYSCDYKFDDTAALSRYDGEWYCQSCFDDIYDVAADYDDSEGQEEYCPPYYSSFEKLHNYSTNVIAMTGIQAEEGKLNLGFEIEVVVPRYYDRDPMRVFYDRANRRAIAKKDSSIGDNSNGFEMVSAPMPLAKLEALVDDLFLTPIPNTIDDDESVGMHVHMSRAVLRRSQMAKMLLFTEAIGNETFMNFLAGRELRDHDFCANNKRRSWQDVFKQHSTAKGKQYSAFVRHFGGGRFMHDIQNTETDGTRYAVLNFNNPYTVECRMFQASTNPSRVKANLEFCAALVEFCGSLRPYSHYGSPKHFIAFLKSRKEFKNLANLIGDGLAFNTPPNLASVASVCGSRY